MRALSRLAESLQPFETGGPIGWSLARHSRARCLPSFVIVPSARRSFGEQAGCTSGDTKAESKITTRIETDRREGRRIRNPTYFSVPFSLLLFYPPNTPANV